MQDSIGERSNVAAHLEGKPAVYDLPPQDDTARFYAKSLMSLIRARKKLEKDENTWLNLYNKHKRRSTREDTDEEESEELNKADIHFQFINKTAELQQNYEERLSKLQENYEKRLGEKDKRIDDLVAKGQEQKGKDFAEMVRLIANANKDGAENANKHLTTAFTATNSLNNTLLQTMQTQWQNVGKLSKQHFDELNKILEQKEKDEPGFFEMFVTEIILPNKDKIGNGLSSLLENHLPKPG